MMMDGLSSVATVSCCRVVDPSTVITSCSVYVGCRWWEPFVARSLLAIFVLELRGGLHSSLRNGDKYDIKPL